MQGREEGETPPSLQLVLESGPVLVQDNYKKKTLNTIRLLSFESF